MQRMNEGLNHQDVVGLEQECAANNCVNIVPANPHTNNAVPVVNEVPTTITNNEED